MSHDDSLHDGSRTYIPNTGTPLVTNQTIADAFIRNLADLNRRRMLKGEPHDIQRDDPRDIRTKIESMCAGARMLGEAGGPTMEQANALGSYALALALAVARVEDQSAHLGDAAA